ncbi:MAG: metallophosphoesterase [Cytophagaceae bacterium]|nr:metallophosphoesterase [Cytophagaceae bacterium]
MKKLLIIAGIAFSCQLTAQQTVKGYVYVDANGNGKKDRKEEVLSNVSVTNGEQVVQTNDKGMYELSLGDENIIAVIKPTGYALPVDDLNIPQFFRIHRPAGSPQLKFKGIAPTGKAPRKLDFAVLPAEENEKFTALIFGDPQPYTMQDMDWFEKGIVSEVEGIQDIPFGMSLGDIVGNNLDLHAPYKKVMKKIGIPWFNVMGNHDMDFDAKDEKDSDDSFTAHFGPSNYAFNYGKVHFIVLDDILYPDPRDHEGYWGGFREDQLNFVENDLRFVPKDYLVVVSYHIPLSEEGDGDSFRDEDRQRLFDLLLPFEHNLTLSAHTHIQRQDFFGESQGWKGKKPHHEYNVGTTSGDWYSGKLGPDGTPIAVMRDGTPKGYAFIHFNGNEYMTDYKVAGKPKEFQMEIFAPKVVAQGRPTKAGIFTNFFMGTEGDEVFYRVDGGEWKKMSYMEEPDPSYVALVYEWDLADKMMPGRRSSNPINCEHLWRGNIPTKLELGEHTIEIKATDQYGQTYTGKRTYKIEESITGN